MCTASWLFSGDGYHLLFNRDEKRTRARGIPPDVWTRGGIQGIAPRDGDSGGTWISVNEFGVSVCLLNGVPKETRPASESRGALVQEMSDADSVGEVRWRIEKTDLARFAPFQLVAIEPGEVPLVWTWGEGRLRLERNARLPLTSSSFDTETVIRSRQTEFERRAAAAGVVDERLLLDFHTSHGPGDSRPSAYSTCMHRQDAETVSFSWIHAMPDEVEFFYAAGAPCHWTPGETVRLQRRKEHALACASQS